MTSIAQIPEDARRSLAQSFGLAYRELAGNEPDAAPRFQFGRAIEAMCTERGLVDGYESEVCSGAANIRGLRHDPHRVVFPFSAFGRRRARHLQRDLVAGVYDYGGALVSSAKQGPADVLRSWSVVARAGTTLLDGLVGNPTIPTVLAAATASWTTTEAQNFSQSEPTLGEAVAAPKHATGYMRVSRQLNVQAEAFDEFVSTQLLEAAAALLDQAVLAGTGATGQPLGIVNTSGVGSQPGATLSHTGTRTMRKQVLDAGAVESRLAWVGATDVQDALSGRERFTGGGRAIWDDGSILGLRANATKHAPVGTLICGDWARAIVCIWGPGFTVEIDPYTFFTTAKIAARIILECDVVLSPAAAFSVSTGVN